jgi:hypothetical protein
MSKRTTETAIAELDALIAQIDQLRAEHRNSANHVRWAVGVLEFFEQVFGQNSRFYLSFAQLKWHHMGGFLVGGPNDPQGSWDPQSAIDRKHHEAYLRDLERAQGLVLASRDKVVRYGIDSVYEGKNTAPEASGLLKILSLAQRKLRKVIRAVPEKERDVQDAMENLLVGADVSFISCCTRAMDSN